LIIIAIGALSSCERGQAEDLVDYGDDNVTEIAALAEDLKTGVNTNIEESASPSNSGLEIDGEFVSPVRSALVGRTSGRIREILVTEGEEVVKGQALLRLETDYLAPQLAGSEAELIRARSALDVAHSDFERKQELRKRNSIPQAVFDRSSGANDQAKAGVQAAEAAVQLARQRLEDAVLYAPIDGVVAERRVEVGEQLSDGKAAYVIVQLNPLRLRFNLSERHLPNVKMGDEARATVEPYPGEVFVGRVVLIGKVVDPVTRTFPVEAEFDNRDRRLRPGLFALVRLGIREENPVDQPGNPDA